jgi:hypothetical protein
MANVREITGHCHTVLGTKNFSSLSHGLRRPSGVAFVRLLVDGLACRIRYRKDELVALDSMAIVFGSNRRHHCERFNDQAVGGGVLWSYRIKTPAGQCPVGLIKLIRGSWNDAGLMKDVCLEPQGPIYLMDRGFYAIDLIGQWMANKVRFIVRVKAGGLKYQVIKKISTPSRLPTGWKLTLDALVELGSPHRKTQRPHVRLIIAYAPSGEQFIYATSQTNAAGEVIKAYKERWHIERFHRFIKDNLGLAHLYSFDANGIEFLILTALLTTMLLFLKAPAAIYSIHGLFKALARARAQLNICVPWHRNILAAKRNPTKRKRYCYQWENP